MYNSAQKTPISLLQELCTQQELTPDYKLAAVEGPVHAPTFIYRVQVGKMVATATGASKKKAKHAVAKAVLEKLLTKEGGYEDGFEADGVKITLETLQEFATESTPDPSSEENVQGNPVGKLQEKCIEKKWQPPLYEMEDESGLPHERTFKIACQVETGIRKSYKETGEGKSKKLAKRQAADNMLRRLLELKLIDVKDKNPLKKESLEEESESFSLKSDTEIVPEDEASACSASQYQNKDLESELKDTEDKIQNSESA